MRALHLGIALGLALAATACGGDDAATDTTTTPASDPTTTTTEPVDTTPGTEAPTTTVAPDTTVAPSTTTTTTTVAPSTTEPSVTDVRVYFLRGERLVIEHRDVAGPAVLTGALTALVAGPTAGEAAAGLVTTIPAGTKVLGVNLVDGVATVDLSREFESGGGTLSMMARVGQVVFTATQFPNVDAVQFWLDGAPIDYLGGEGLIMDEPWERMMVDRDITGAVIVDTPAYGATVRSPFTVAGEGDVFEAQFPIEIWRDGVQIGGVEGVWAGAWGTWADFSATITLDAAPGPIEIVTYDAGGCGDGPDCPPIVKTVVPLTLTR